MSTSEGETFHLQWNDFEKNISAAFKELKEEKDFFDVTLVCEDSQIQAHKVILSACSEFFRSILKKNPHQHPLLYLKGVRYKDLVSLLSFMYLGEVTVAQGDLNTFLAVAEDLQVKGLAQNKKVVSNKLIHLEERKQTEERAIRIKPYSRNITGSDNDLIQPARETSDPLLNIKLETPAGVECVEEANEMLLDNEYEDEHCQYEPYQPQYEDHQLLCDPGTNRGWANTLKPFPCQYCSKSFLTQNSLQKHAKSHTGQTYCEICDKNFSTVPYLRAHVNNVHSKK